jgi:hypothetical protein
MSPGIGDKEFLMKTMQELVTQLLQGIDGLDDVCNATVAEAESLVAEALQYRDWYYQRCGPDSVRDFDEVVKANSSTLEFVAYLRDDFLSVSWIPKESIWNLIEDVVPEEPTVDPRFQAYTGPTEADLYAVALGWANEYEDRLVCRYLDKDPAIRALYEKILAEVIEDEEKYS